MGIAEFPFWIFLGDIHGEIRTIPRIKDVQKAQGIVVTGDIGKNGTLGDAKKVMQALEACNKKIYAQIGNMDTAQVDGYLSERRINLHKRHIETNTILLLGMGGSLPTPFSTSSEFAEEFYEENLKKFAMLPKKALTVFISHNPPYGTECDRLKNGKHVGSKAILKFIQDYQPDFCICGHIHESRAKDTIGKTTVFNLGAFASGCYGKLVLSETPEMELCTIN